MPQPSPTHRKISNSLSSCQSRPGSVFFLYSLEFERQFRIVILNWFNIEITGSGIPMGIPSEMRQYWAQAMSSNNQRLNPSFVVPSPAEDQRILEARRCTQEGVRAGATAAVIAAGVSAVPTLVAVRTLPWAKANLNYTAQALIISAASIAAYFITADKTILECARRNAQYDKNA